MAKNSTIPLPDTNIPTEEKYEHIFDTFTALWNEALNHIYAEGGAEGMARYNARAMDRDVMAKSVFQGAGDSMDAAELLRTWLLHHVMMNSEYEILEATPEKIVVDITRCGSKSRLARRFGGEKCPHYCSHCKDLKFYEQVGWSGSIDTTHAARIDGENIGCRRTFVRCEQPA